MAHLAAHADAAGARQERLCAGQRHQNLVRHFRPRRAGDPAPWRPRQFQLLGQAGAGAGPALSRHRHGQPRPRPLIARRAAIRLRSHGVRRDGADGLSEDRKSRSGRLERRRHYRPRHRACIIPSGSPSFLPSRQTPTPAPSRTSNTIRFSAPSSRGRERSTRSSRRRPPNTMHSSPRSPKCGRRSRTGPPTISHGIKVPTWIVDADHDEAIKRENTLFMADNIPDSGLLIQPDVSHFSFIQDPAQFNADVKHFLAHLQGK